MIAKNAITMRGQIDRCWLVAFRADPVEVAAALPAPLKPVLYGDYAFLNVVVCHLRHMRPAPLPAWCGMSYWHAAYRVYARYQPPDGPEVEGLFFLRSDADSPLMVTAGNLLTDFRFSLSKVGVSRDREITRLSVDATDFPLNITLLAKKPTRTPGSPFPTLCKASEFLEYEPAGLSVAKGRCLAMRISRDERNWQHRLLTVERFEAPFLDRFSPVPEVAYEVEMIDYQWNRAELL